MKLIRYMEEVERAEAWPQTPEPELPTETQPAGDSPTEDNVIVLPTALPGHFDLTDRLGGILPDLPANKRAPTNKEPARIRPANTVTTLCLHQMAVAFGVSKSRVRYWRGQIAEASALVRDLYQFAALGVEQSEEAANAFARRIALHERMCKISYHYAALLNGDRLKINAADLYTYHGNGANKRSIGLAVEGLFPGLEEKRAAKHNDLDDFLIETIRGLVRLAIMDAEAAGMPITQITAHRVYSGNRVADPGELIWEEVALWAIREFGLTVDYELQVGSGRPIPFEWDESALYDYRGKRIRHALKEAA